SAKSPVTLIPVMDTAVVPVFESVTVMAALEVLMSWLPKDSAKAATVTNFAMPSPDRPTLWGLPGALSVMTKAPASEPAAVGLKVTLSVQLVFGGSGTTQVFVTK